MAEQQAVPQVLQWGHLTSGQFFLRVNGKH